MDSNLIQAKACRLTLSDDTYLIEELISLTYSAGCSSSTTGPTLGSAVAASVTVKLAHPLPLLEGRDVTLEVQTGPNAWAPLGRFRFQTPEVGEETTTVTAVDAMLYALESGYFPSEPAPATALGVLRDLCSQSGLDLGNVSGLTDVPVSGSLEGCTRREMAGYMAALLGRNAVIGPTGALELIWYTPSGVTVTADDYYSGGFTRKDYDWTLSGLVASTGASDSQEEDALTAGTTLSPIRFSNPYLTQSILNGIWTELQGFSYRPGEVTLLGNLAIGPGDLVTVTDRSGADYTLAVMAVEHSYDGGWKTKLTAYGTAEADVSANYKGPMTQAMERYTAQMASFQKLYAQDMTVVNGQITHLEAQNANLQDLVAAKADVEDLTAAHAEIKQLTAELANVEALVADKADLDALHATNANVDKLTAGLANVETLLAGSAGVGNLQAIHLTGDNVVIDDAIITDAMIASLSAGKLTAGTLYTSLVRIASDQDENLVIDGATLQLKDANGVVRVQIGKDAAGDYSYYLWDAGGNLMWSPTGVTSAGLNDGIIRDINVAEDAAISGNKLDISSVAQRLNEDGSLTVEAGQVTIDGTKLDVAYKEVSSNASTAQKAAETAQEAADAAAQTAQAAQNAAGAAAQNAAAAQSTADTAKANAAAAQTAADTAKADAATAQQQATDAQAAAEDALDQVAAITTRTTALETDFTVVQGQITSKVWQTDITEATSPLADRLTTVEDQYSHIDQTVDGISLSVGSLQTSFENLKVGGRNLQKGSEHWSEAAFYRAGDGLISGDTLTIPVGSVKVETHFLPVQPGELYTIGVDMKGESSYTANLFVVEFFDQEEQRISYQWVRGSVTTSWSRIAQTVEIPEAIALLRVGLRSSASVKNSYRRLKIERGTLATDWTPAPEDVTTQVDQVRGELALKIDKDDNDKIVSMLNASADVINLEGQRITIDSPKFKLAADGTIEATDGKFSGEIVAKSLQVVSDWWVLAASEAGVSITVPSENDIGLVLGAASTLSGYRSAKLQGGSASLSVGTGGSSINSGFSVEGDLTADKMTASGVIESQRGVVSANAFGFYGKNTAGTNVKLLSVTGSDNVVLGDQDLPLYLWGSKISAPALIQSGTTGTVSVAAQSYTDVTVTFSQAFPGTPCVVATLGNTASESQNMGKVVPIIFQRSATRAVIRIFNTAAGLVNVLVHWQATYQA